MDGIHLSAEEAKGLYRQVHGKAMGLNLVKLFLVVGAVSIVSAPVTIALVRVAMSLPSAGAAVIAVLTGLVMGCLFAFVARRGFIYIFRREIREAMGEMGYRLCASCGYWLRGHEDVDQRCPECGVDSTK